MITEVTGVARTMKQNLFDFQLGCRVGFLVGCCTLAIFCGCGRSGDLVKVSGTVTYKGQLLDKGQIRFFPMHNTKGPTSGATIAEGKYRVTNRGGLRTGTYRVEIRAYYVDQSEELAQDGGPPRREQLIPTKYNDESELTVTIPTDKQSYEVDFEVLEN